MTAKALQREECVRCGRSSYETGVAAVGSGERMRGMERKERGKERGGRRTDREVVGQRAQGTAPVKEHTEVKTVLEKGTRN